MDDALLGLHHVTAIAGDAQRNLDFYAGTLGLRLVKHTVNFDDPSTLHLYYGDGLGTPGSIVTFFAWPGGRRGRQGTGQAAVVSLAIAPESIGYWIARLIERGVAYEGPLGRFGAAALALRDPDGLLIELVAAPEAPPRASWPEAPVPPEHAIRGLYGATLWQEGYELTARQLTETLGFRLVAEEENVFRFAVGPGGPGALLDVRCTPGFWAGEVEVGTVHHLAWRAATPAQQQGWRQRVAAAGLDVTPVLDRQYFQSIYFREPGGVLFEIATDPPGFARDEPVEHLGERLMLPPWLEPRRAALEAALPQLRRPGSNPHGYVDEP